MMSRLTLTALCLAMVSLTGQAIAQGNWYLRTNLGFAVAPGLTLNAYDND